MTSSKEVPEGIVERLWLAERRGDIRKELAALHTAFLSDLESKLLGDEAIEQLARLVWPGYRHASQRGKQAMLWDARKGLTAALASAKETE